ncbi:tyrosine-type recombinase/integrase [Bradyrhizobium cosmicum]|uniref:tyrosine-type recombinase/integrase n=1 Tax=Bradyrhizobium cosmicum TaxID=1404864 RepID=UPI0011622E3E|nr:tyrosine-type recombinase/integrase [Bradyrhizobium cosmicum]QDP26162.1 phage integrase family protein [Bradyrhizobium cosmicum]
MRILPSSADCEALASFEPEDDREAAMWNAIVALIYSVGAMPSELAKVRWKDADRPKVGQWVLRLEGQAARQVPVLGWSSDRLRTYERLCRPIPEAGLMFPSDKKRFVDVASSEIRRRSRILGISPTATPTTIRRACVRDLIRAGATLEDVADLLGVKRLDAFNRFVKSLFPPTD